MRDTITKTRDQYASLEDAAMAVLAGIHEARQPHPLPLHCSLEELTREAAQIGGEGTRVELECVIEDGKPVYHFSIWSAPSVGGDRPWVGHANARECLERFRLLFLPEPPPVPATTAEEVRMLLQPAVAF